MAVESQAPKNTKKQVVSEQTRWDRSSVCFVRQLKSTGITNARLGRVMIRLQVITSSI